MCINYRDITKNTFKSFSPITVPPEYKLRLNAINIWHFIILNIDIFYRGGTFFFRISNEDNQKLELTKFQFFV